MSKGNIKIGFFEGTGAAINIECGFMPTCVWLYNATDGTTIQAAWLQWVVPFTSGGTSTIAAGATIRGVTSLATATVQAVTLNTTGSFAGGDAAGFLVLQEGSLVGTFQSENIVVTNLATGVIGTDDATVTVNVVHNCAITSAAAAATTAATSITRYEGVAASNAKGFTVGATLNTANKAMRYLAIRDDA